MQKNSVTTKQQWTKAALNDPRYFSVVGSGVEAWVGKKNFLSTKSVQGTRIVAIEGEIDYLNRPSRANMQPKLGRVAFAKMKDTFKVLVADEVLSKKYILSTGFALIEPSIDSNYLYQYFQSEKFNLQKNRYSEGSTQQAISQSDFANIEILFPISRDEQKRIAEVLELIDQTIEQTEALIKKYERVRAGMMRDAVISCSRLERKPLGSLREYITSGSRGWAKYYSDEGAIFLRIGNMTRENINLRFDDTVYVNPPEGSEGNRTKTKAGDVLVSITADLGIIALIPEGLGDAYVNQHIALLRFADTETISPWVAIYLSSSEGQKQFATLNDGGAKAGLNLPTVDGIQIPLPSEKVRRAIIQSIASVDKVIAAEKTQRQKLKALKTGLMTDLLTGAVRTIEK